MDDVFSAGEQAAGYLYQVRYALLLALQDDKGRATSLEFLDDVHFEEQGRAVDLFQLKHHYTCVPANLTDRSPDLWKTLRVWSTRVKSGQVDPSCTRFHLVTTSTAAEGSIAAGLKASQTERNAIVQRLVEIARTGGSSTNQSSFDAFLTLTEEQQTSLVHSIVVLDNAPNALNLDQELDKELRWLALPQYKSPFRQQLEGWWFEVALKLLLEPSAGPISSATLQQRIADIRDQFRPTSLPDEMSGVDVPSASDARSLKNRYLLQLELIRAQDTTREVAIRDYYRALEQRSRWVRNDLVGLHELPKYDGLLREEWEIKRAIMVEDLTREASEDLKVQHGRELYRSLLVTGPQYPIRPDWTAPYLHRGSYHILANSMKVGWHPDFLQRLSVVDRKEDAGGATA